MSIKNFGRPRGRAGFTLLEVLIAFVILAVGLLALEALGIGAARMVTRAQRLATYNIEATSVLESSMERVRRGQVPADSTGNLTGATITRRTSQNGRLYNIRVSVRPAAGRVLALSDSFALSGNVFR